MRRFVVSFSTVALAFVAVFANPASAQRVLEIPRYPFFATITSVERGRCAKHQMFVRAFVIRFGIR